jgi:hypothetical protein
MPCQCSAGPARSVGSGSWYRPGAGSPAQRSTGSLVDQAQNSSASWAQARLTVERDSAACGPSASASVASTLRAERPVDEPGDHQRLQRVCPGELRALAAERRTAAQCRGPSGGPDAAAAARLDRDRLVAVAVAPDRRLDSTGSAPDQERRRRRACLQRCACTRSHSVVPLQMVVRGLIVFCFADSFLLAARRMEGLRRCGGHHDSTTSSLRSR